MSPPGDVHEDQDDPEHDQPEQEPEQDPVEEREVAAGGVPAGAKGTREQSGGRGCLANGRRVGLRVVVDGAADADPEQQAERKQEGERKPLRAARVGNVKSNQAAQSDQPRDEPLPARQLTADVDAGCGEGDGDRN